MKSPPMKFSPTSMKTTRTTYQNLQDRGPAQAGAQQPHQAEGYPTHPQVLLGPASTPAVHGCTTAKVNSNFAKVNSNRIHFIALSLDCHMFANVLSEC